MARYSPRAEDGQPTGTHTDGYFFKTTLLILWSSRRVLPRCRLAYRGIALKILPGVLAQAGQNNPSSAATARRCPR